MMRNIFNLVLVLLLFFAVFPFQATPQCSSRFTIGYHNCVLNSNQDIKCFGRGHYGALGHGDNSTKGNDPNELADYLPLVNIPEDISAVYAAGEHSCLISSTLNVKCWGYNQFGQLGIGSSDDKGDEPNELGVYLPNIDFGLESFEMVVGMSVGRRHSCVKLSSGKIRCWGRSVYGELGYGDSLNRGDGPNEMSDYLPEVNLGSGLQASQIKLSQYSSCALMEGGEMKCWGRNHFGQCGLGNTSSIGYLPNQMSDYLPPINFPSGVNIASIDTGYNHHGAISIIGDLYLWGRNENGGLGLGHANHIGDSGNEMGEYLQSTNLGNGRTIIAFGGGVYHTCALLDGFDVKCFGSNTNSQLGYGDISTRGNSASEMGNYLLEVNLGSGLTAQSLHIGYYHSCVVLNDNSFKCWGYNNYGQLGKGHTTNVGGNVNEMGDYLGPINLGTGVEVTLCFDYSPTSQPSFTPTTTHSPSFTFSPSLSPTSFLQPSCFSRFSFGYFITILTSDFKVFFLVFLSCLIFKNVF